MDFDCSYSSRPAQRATEPDLSQNSMNTRRIVRVTNPQNGCAAHISLKAAEKHAKAGKGRLSSDKTRFHFHKSDHRIAQECAMDRCVASGLLSRKQAKHLPLLGDYTRIITKRS